MTIVPAIGGADSTRSHSSSVKSAFPVMPELLPVRRLDCHIPALMSGVATDQAREALPAMTMPLEEAIQTQRSIRRLKPDPVDDALVIRLIELALKAPTGSNAQNWEFVVVKDRAVKERLARLNRVAWSIYGRIGRRANRDRPAMQRLLDAVEWQGPHLAPTPRGIGPRLRGARLPFPPLAASSYYGSIYPSVQNLLL